MIVGKVGDNQVFSRWEIGPVAGAAGSIGCCGEGLGQGLEKVEFK